MHDLLESTFESELLESIMFLYPYNYDNPLGV
jgi:hypothetical protein